MAHSKQVSVKPTATEAVIKELENNIEHPAKESKAAAAKPDTTQELKPNAELVDQWEREWEEGRERAIPTGFENLDKILDGGLYPGLYTIGAISSLGKTTFALQIADYIASEKEGKEAHDVLYITLEQGAAELTAKSISRLTAELNKDTSDMVTCRQVTSWNRRQELGQSRKDNILKAEEYYKKHIGNHIFMMAGVGDIGVAQIKKQIEAHIKSHKKTPVIVIDYAQILAAPAGERLTDKQMVDKNVVELKRMARDFLTPILAVSSFNRDNYTTAVSLAAFKESGAIEYTSDCIIAIQPKGIQDAKPDSNEARANKKVIKKCKRAKIRTLEAHVLKNRQGGCSGVYLEYRTLFNLYIDKGEIPPDAEESTGGTKQKTEATHKRADQLPAGKPV